MTGLFLLTESHLACHTYPETGIATFNLYCCRTRPRWPWQEKLRTLLGAARVTVRSTPRGGRDGLIRHRHRPSGKEARMSGVKVSCPACGGPIAFPIGSAIVAVCPYCRSVVARGDRKIEDLGKVAALVETDSVLEVGLKGRYQGVPFELTGRTQLGHPAGGVWDEWYAAFADGRWGWLAEAQGRLYLTFEKEPGHAVLPLYEDLQLGERLHLPGTPAALTVAEKSHARAVSAEGAIPFRLVPGVSSFYADLSGPAGEFATLDYGATPPQVFLGREVSLDDLGLPPKVQPRQREARQVAGVHLNCPQCGGALELRAPDKSERVVCPNCAALLDANQGQLRYLQTLKQGRLRPRIPLGTTGTLHGQSYMVIGFLQRSVRFEGVKYFWEEYLLYDGRLGFRWLVCSEHHWNFVEPLAPGKVQSSGRGAMYEGNFFTVFQKATATVENVQGEFYWKVSAGEEVQASDFVRPPLMLSREVSVQGGEGRRRNQLVARNLSARGRGRKSVRRQIAAAPGAGQRGPQPAVRPQTRVPVLGPVRRRRFSHAHLLHGDPAAAQGFRADVSGAAEQRSGKAARHLHGAVLASGPAERAHHGARGTRQRLGRH